MERHRSRGELTARERIDRLLDPGTALLELNALAAWDIYGAPLRRPGSSPGSGSSRARSASSSQNDATVKGGSYFPLTVKKHLRAQEVAEQNHLPCIYLVDSGGAFPSSRPSLPRPGALRPDLLQPGTDVRPEFGHAHRDGLLHCGGAYVPAMSDQVDHRPGHQDDLHRRPLPAREGHGSIRTP